MKFEVYCRLSLRTPQYDRRYHYAGSSFDELMATVACFPFHAANKLASRLISLACAVRGTLWSANTPNLLCRPTVW